MSPVAQLVARSPRTVLTAKRRNRSLQDRRTARPNAYDPRNVGGQSCIRRLVHQWQRSPDAFVGDEAQERRLLKLRRESLAERIVEHRVARRVGELGEHDRVLVGERRCPRREDVGAHEDCRCHGGGSRDETPARARLAAPDGHRPSPSPIRA